MSKRTIRCKLAPTTAAEQSLGATCRAFTDACNAILAVAVRERVSNNVRLHHLTYNMARAEFKLSANLAVRAVRRVAAAMTAAKRSKRQPKQFRPTSIDYDARVFAYRERDETVSLTTVHGRVHVPLVLGQYQREALRGRRPTAATVVPHANRWEITITVEEV